MTKVPRLTALFFAAMLTGCGAGARPARVPASDPANPRAAEAPADVAGSRLRPDEFDQPVEVAGFERPAGSKTTPTTPQHLKSPSRPEHGSGGGAKKQGGPAPPSTKSTQTLRSTQQTALYVCPMHPEVTDSIPSKCPKCGMTLVRKKERQ